MEKVQLGYFIKIKLQEFRLSKYQNIGFQINYKKACFPVNYKQPREDIWPQFYNHFSTRIFFNLNRVTFDNVL